MARIKYGSLVSDISGSIGSATFQKSLYGNTLRNKPLPRKSRSESQMNSRSIMMRVHAAWTDLTDAQRQQWNQFIAFASASIRRDRHVLQTGHSYFIKYNFMRLLAHLSIQTVPLYTQLTVGFPTFNLSWADDDNTWDFVPNATAPGTDLWFTLRLSNKVTGAKAFNPAGLRYMYIPVSDDGTYPMRDIYYNVFGYLLQDQDYVNYSIQYFGLTNTMISGIYTGVKKLF